jgi:hypothetical protein
LRRIDGAWVAGRRGHHHMNTMSSSETPPDTTFRIFLMDDKSYGIEVTIPDSFPTTVKSFPSEEAAENWIANYQIRLAEKTTRKTWRRRQPPPEIKVVT